ncbi:MAG: GGDEF domain-containing protein [Cyanobacteria bacterium J06623_4]
MNSVLLIGHSGFTTSVRSQVRGLESLTVRTASNASEGMSLLESSSPDVVIFQASILKQDSVVKTFGRSHSAYFIAIETAEHPVCEADQLNTLQIEKTALALESGSDAYLWLPPADQRGQVECYQGPTAAVALELTAVTAADRSGLDRRSPERNMLAGTQRRSTHPSNRQSQDLPSLIFRQNQCRLIQAHIQIGLSRAQRYRDLSRINDWLSAVALVDALTQISNRRAFDLELPNQIKMTRSKGTPLSLMVLDIDFFKGVNDRFGHLVGDEILKQLAQRLLANMRFYDTPFRYGGEEFVVTLTNTDLVEGSAIANRLRESIARDPFKIAPPVNGLTALEVTVSIGIAELLPEDDEQGRSLLDRADQNLLKAKDLGRNRVIGLGIDSQV